MLKYVLYHALLCSVLSIHQIIPLVPDETGTRTRTRLNGIKIKQKNICEDTTEP